MMKKRFIYCVFMFAVLAVQIAVVPAFFHGQVVPSALFMLVLAWSLVDGFIPFLFWAIGFGIAADALSASPIGSHVVMFAILSYAASFLSRRFLSGGFAFMAFLIFCTTLAVRVLRMVILLEGGASFKIASGIFLEPGAILLETVANMIIFSILLFAIKRIKKFFWIE